MPRGKKNSKSATEGKKNRKSAPDLADPVLAKPTADPNDTDDNEKYNPWIDEFDADGKLVKSTFNPHSEPRLAGVSSRHHFGYEKVMVVNASAAPVYLPQMKVRPARAGEDEVKWMETGEKWELKPCQAMLYHKNALNSDTTPLVEKQTPEGHPYNLTVEQTIEMMKRFPDLVAEMALEAYVTYVDEDRTEVLAFYWKHLKAVKARRKAALAF